MRHGCDEFFGDLRSAADRTGFDFNPHTRPMTKYWSESCYADVHIPAFDKSISRAYGIEKPLIGVASTVEWIPDENKLWGEILVPMCSSEPGHKFLLTPSVELAESCEIEQVHCHSGAVPSCHIHFSCDAGAPGTASVGTLFRKLGALLGNLNSFASNTCGVSY